MLREEIDAPVDPKYEPCDLIINPDRSQRPTGFLRTDTL